MLSNLFGDPVKDMPWKEVSVAVVTRPLFTKGTRQQHVPNQFSSTRLYQPDILCEACIEILHIIKSLVSIAGSDRSKLFGTISLDYMLSDVRTSADLGCHMCSMIVASVLSYFRDGKPAPFDSANIEDSFMWLKLSPSDTKQCLCTIRVRLTHSEVDLVTRRSLHVYPLDDYTEKKGHDGDDPPPASLGPDTDDEATFRFVTHWLQGCRNNHAPCNQRRSLQPNTPRRLLHLQEEIVTVTENTESCEYVCLSHCWGSQNHVPERPRIVSPAAPIKIAVLPKTFRDAILITKKLGFTYLWIDCFCILQGSKEDWLEQSAVMAQIYANSALVISALKSQDSQGGCFTSRNPLALRALHTQDFVIQFVSTHEPWEFEVGKVGPQASPLHKRAWCVQERLASPRSLLYGSLGVYWECRCMQASECHIRANRGTPDNVKNNLAKLEEAARDDDIGAVRSEDGSYSIGTSFYDRWEHLLGMYSACDLTMPTDKLIALSGIANGIEKSSRRRYVQGLWKEDLTRGLSWFLALDHTELGPQTPGGRLDNGLPSWSWASTTGQIRFFSSGGNILWRAPIFTREAALHLRTWKREVRLSVDEVYFLNLVDDGSRRGDCDEDYYWYPDDPKLAANILRWIVLIERKVWSEKKPSSGSDRCVVVSHVIGNIYRRVGITNWKFSKARDDPFPSQPDVVEEEIVLI